MKAGFIEGMFPVPDSLENEGNLSEMIIIWLPRQFAEVMKVCFFPSPVDQFFCRELANHHQVVDANSQPEIAVFNSFPQESIQLGFGHGVIELFNRKFLFHLGLFPNVKRTYTKGFQQYNDEDSEKQDESNQTYRLF